MNKLLSGLIYIVVSVIIGLIMIFFLYDYIFSSRITIVTFIAMISIYVVPLILGGIISVWLEKKFGKESIIDKYLYEDEDSLDEEKD